ncbi:hypothetical protein EMIT0158MI4_160161 [Burkholderia ambifaria]
MARTKTIDVIPKIVGFAFLNEKSVIAFLTLAGKNIKAIATTRHTATTANVTLRMAMIAFIARPGGFCI